MQNYTQPIQSSNDRCLVPWWPLVCFVGVSRSKRGGSKSIIFRVSEIWSTQVSYKLVPPCSPPQSTIDKIYWNDLGFRKIEGTKGSIHESPHNWNQPKSQNVTVINNVVAQSLPVRDNFPPIHRRRRFCYNWGKCDSYFQYAAIRRTIPLWLNI